MPPNDDQHSKLIYPCIPGVKTTSKVTVLANDSPHGVVFWETSLTTMMEPEGTDLTLKLNVIREQGSEGTIRVLFVYAFQLSSNSLNYRCNDSIYVVIENVMV